MLGFAQFMSSGMEPTPRITAVLVLVGLGIFFANGTLGLILIIVSAVPLLTDIFDVCIIGALLLGTPLRSAEVRGNIKE